MDYVLKGYITENGELQVELPPGIPPGEVQITIQAQPAAPSQDETWPEEERADLFPPPEPLPDFKAQSGAEVIAMLDAEDGWWDADTPDGQTWVEERRRKAAERRKLPKW